MTGSDERDLDGFFSSARVTGRDDAVTLTADSYRDFLFPADDPHVAEWRGQGWEEFAARRTDHPFVQQLLDDWRSLYDEPFRGVTSDGVVRDVWRLDADGRNDPEVAAAAMRARDALSDDERAAFAHAVDAPEWRAWSNPEFAIFRVGVRLEDLSDDKVAALLALVRASLSPEGYARVTEAMRLNGFLGELTGLPRVMNDRSYFMSLFGDPSSGDDAWGWQLFGHHVALNFVTVAGREVVAPQFIGAEPALTDGDRPPIFDRRERIAIALASSLTPSQRADAVVYESVLDQAMPEGRLHPADERHLAGAFRDNRVIPYEGILASALSDDQRGLLRDIVEDFHLLLRDEQRAAAMADYDRHIDDTRFCWYGATDGTQPVYFRIQSPVIVAELDNHAGVWLSNTEPARFHVHTTLRLPNGNDYATAYRRQAAAN